MTGLSSKSTPYFKFLLILVIVITKSSNHFVRVNVRRGQEVHASNSVERGALGEDASRGDRHVVDNAANAEPNGVHES